MSTYRPSKHLRFVTNCLGALASVSRPFRQVAGRPLVHFAWQHGYQGDTIWQAIPRATPYAAGAVAVVGAFKDIFGEVGSVALDGAGAQLVSCALVAGIVGFGVSRFLDAQADKMKGYLSREEKRDLYLGSLILGENVDTASQAYLLGRAIHDIGFGVMGKLAVEMHEDQLDKLGVPPREKQTLTAADTRQLISEYLWLCKLIGLADSMGLERAESRAPHSFTERMLKPIEKAFEKFSAEGKHPELCKMYHDTQAEYLPKPYRGHLKKAETTAAPC